MHLNLVPSTRVMRELFEMPENRADDCRVIGNWLAAQAGIPLTDDTAAVPMARSRRSRGFGIQ